MNSLYQQFLERLKADWQVSAAAAFLILMIVVCGPSRNHRSPPAVKSAPRTATLPSSGFTTLPTREEVEAYAPPTEPRAPSPRWIDAVREPHLNPGSTTTGGTPFGNPGNTTTGSRVVAPGSSTTGGQVFPDDVDMDSNHPQSPNAAPK